MAFDRFSVTAGRSDEIPLCKPVSNLVEGHIGHGVLHAEWCQNNLINIVTPGLATDRLDNVAEHCHAQI